jgi:hypothetical protein
LNNGHVEQRPRRKAAALKKKQHGYFTAAARSER